MPNVESAGSSAFSSCTTLAACRSPDASPATMAIFIAAEANTWPKPRRCRRRTAPERWSGTSSPGRRASSSRAGRRIGRWPRRRGTSEPCGCAGGSFLPILRDVVDVCYEQQVHQAGGEGEGGAVLERDRANVAKWSEVPGDEVRQSDADRSQSGELVQQAPVGRVEVPVDGDADHEERHDDGEEGRGAASPAEVEVAGTGKKQRQDHCGDRAASHTRLSTLSKWGASLSKVVLRSSGTTRVRAVTVMKFESPLQRGTMCMW